ncbi:hypothetical protein PQC07_gp244 [Aeromonas phage D3]|uniref:Uncharacterized protein n=1 Tax=Aeromonas phage D3 TaxID=2593327 RepID=A0A514TVN2_9CAUD|nr:hypothetical protein PQC07_gp244 [Aeromonas phage D3]QDJ97030.1 hypothetical protein D3_0031 [Aeromonas phage D3]QEP52336.1 hypothetical protein D9_0129 [Aeromonas phage D9]
MANKSTEKIYFDYLNKLLLGTLGGFMHSIADSKAIPKPNQFEGKKSAGGSVMVAWMDTIPLIDYYSKMLNDQIFASAMIGYRDKDNPIMVDVFTVCMTIESIYLIDGDVKYLLVKDTQSVMDNNEIQNAIKDIVAKKYMAGLITIPRAKS